MAISKKELDRIEEELVRKTRAAFRKLFDPDRQDQLVTLTQRESEVLRLGHELQAMMLKEHLASDPHAGEAALEGIRCPRCREVGAPDPEDPEPVPRVIQTQAGPQEILRRKYRCPSCRTVFFPL
ncbi:MAG: hypothetical protein N3A38_11360 [Planctomycetota bacterium]|nr:hypothetical protein [Planctomycetota bacterium]